MRRLASGALVCLAMVTLAAIGYASGRGLIPLSYSYGYQYCSTPGQYQYCSTSSTSSSTTTTTSSSTSTTTRSTTTTTTPTTTTTKSTSTTTTTPKLRCGLGKNMERCEIKINDVSKKEGNVGTTPFVFTVSLDRSPIDPVTVKYATSNVTATAPSDYIATSGTVVFPSGVQQQTITVLVKGDTTREGNETFFVILSNPSPNAVFEDSIGVGTILNDD